MRDVGRVPELEGAGIERVVNRVRRGRGWGRSVRTECRDLGRRGGIGVDWEGWKWKKEGFLMVR